MAERKTEGSMALSPKENQVIVINPIKKNEAPLLRVAAYCRVSSDSSDQMNSFAAQNTYYTTLISGNRNWEMADLYADAGITGTSAAKRPEFQRLIADCKKGKIDRVLVKSISRFARNTKECLEYTRALKAIGVGIFFEEQNIDTSRVSGEMLTAIFAAIAQKQSESISQNLRWSYQKRMQSGKFITCKAPFGYRLADGTLQICEPEATVVRNIFENYLSGKSRGEIAAELRVQNAPTRIDVAVWSDATVYKILRNERYAGDALLQKFYSNDSFPIKKKRNHGEKDQYYIAETHPAIINKTIYEAAQNLSRNRLTPRVPNSDEACFTKKILCGNCGQVFRKKVMRETVYWVCRCHFENSASCSIKQLPEHQLQSRFVCTYNKLKQSRVLQDFCKNIEKIRYNRLLWSMDIISLNKRTSDITSQNQLLAELQKQGLVDSDIFISQSNQLAQQLRTAKQEKERLIALDDDDTIAQTQELMDAIEHGPDFLMKFDEELFGDLVERIIVESNESLRFRLKNGLELRESIERTMR